MISRRDVLIGAGAACAAAVARPIESAFAKAVQPTTAVNFSVPAGACDSHCCVVGDPARYPFTEDRGYTPERASLEELRAVHRALHLQRVVLVQPSFYGTDSSIILDTIKQLGPRARGVVLLDDKASNAELDRLAHGGICGIICAAGTGSRGPEEVRRRYRAALERIGSRPWHIEFHGHLEQIGAIEDLLMQSSVPVIFDHFGGAKPELGVDQPGFSMLLRLVHSGKAYVDISAPYRVSKKAPDYPDVVPIARAIIKANPERVTWGTGWPHPEHVDGRSAKEISPLLQIDDGRNLNLVPKWTSGPAELKLALVDNPARLYGF